MGHQETSIRHSALGWVKKSIDDNISEIKEDLKQYIEAEDEALLHGVKERVGVIQGVLTMIEQYGAAMLTEEMVALTDFIIDNEQGERDGVLEVLLRAVLQLPDYLEHVQLGHQDIPVAILPLLNDIRTVMGRDLFSDKLLFIPDLSMHQEEADVLPIDNDSNLASKLLIKKLRPIYQLALVNVIKEQSVEENLQRLEKVCETLEERSVSEQAARIWWIIGALIDAVSHQQLELGVSIKILLGKVDALFRVILIIGEGGLLQHQPVELIKNFLFFIAQPECDRAKAQAIKTAYRLEQFLPPMSARSEVQDNIAGPNQALLKTVAEAIKADIEAVKSTLEVYVNGDLSKVPELKGLPRKMHVISDTLAMIGLGPQRALITAQIDVIKGILAGNQVADEQLLSMAGELLQVEQALDQMQKRQPGSATQSESGNDISRDYELDSVLSAVVTATLDNIQKTKNAILEFVEEPSHGENIGLCVTLMEESRGALELLNQHRAVAVLDGLLAYLKSYDIVDIMQAERLDEISQVVVSLEYYLEAFGEHRSDADDILDFADTQLQDVLAKVSIKSKGGDLAIAADQVEGGGVEAEPTARSSDGASDAAHLRSETESETEAGGQSVAAAGMGAAVQANDHLAGEEMGDEPESRGEALDGGQVEPGTALGEAIKTDAETIGVPVDEELEVLKPGSDPEILKIYIEEAEEEQRNIARLQRDWLLHPEDENAVKNIRRAFHTLKGGGRLVGAMKIGEFAGDYEHLLNQVIGKRVPHGQPVIASVAKAAAALSELVQELKTGVTPEADINYLRGLARALTECKADRLPSDFAQETHAREPSYVQEDDDDNTEWKGIGTGATTQILPSEKSSGPALESIEPDTIRVDPSAFELIKSRVAENGNDGQTDSAKPGYDDTQLSQPSQIPGTQNYTPAIDYAQTGIEKADAGGDRFEATELGEIGRLATDTIKIQSIGEDFVGGDPDDDSDDAPETTVSELTAADVTTVEASDVDTPAAEEIEEDESREGSPGPLVEKTGRHLPENEAGGSESRVQEPPLLTGLSFAPELLIIFQQEVEQHLDTISSALDHARQIQELIPSEEMYRALHTIHGASRTASISTIGELAGLMEKPLKLAITQKMALDHEIIALYQEGQRTLRAMTGELVSTRQLPRLPGDIKTSFKALAEDFEEHTIEIQEDVDALAGAFTDTLTLVSDAAETEQDNELLSIFIDEANELLEMSDNTLHEWSGQQSGEPGSDDYRAVMELQRYLHTLKGGARMAELKEISDLSHEMESLFIAVIDGRVDKDDDLIELLKDCFDLLHRQVVEAQAKQQMSDCTALVKLLRKLRFSENDRIDEPFGQGGSFAYRGEGIGTGNENLSEDTLTEIERPSQDVIKVRSDLLDNLVNSAGEVSICRARMEQQVAGLGSHLGELGQTISRLKGQLHSLEAETDAQIHFSHRSESGKAGEFDPLEMDRYTMIQELSRSLSESVNDLSSLQGMLGEQVKDSETLLLQQSRVNTDLQDGLIKSRMVKFSGLLARLRRLVRQSSQELGKKAKLIVSGEENEVDNKVLDRMVAPLEHIIRNALSHGIETPMERVNKGKPESGRITIDIARDGSDIVIRVSDDGAGISVEKVRSRAIQLGLFEESHEVSDGDLLQCILEPGFSTAEHVTQMSGRGIGMDVVDIEIKQLGGTLQIETNPQGTTFIARLPFTLSINQAILVRTGEETYAIPLINIEGITRLSNQQMIDYYNQDEPALEYAGQDFALHSLSKLVGLGVPFRPGAEGEKQAVILCRAADVSVALHVDELIGNREIVVKPLGKQLSQVKALAGASVLADGGVALILDINGLVRHSNSSAVKIVYQQRLEPTPNQRRTIMVVDDSITMRRVASKLLERHHYEVVTAKDGVDALAQLQELRPDVMLLDIEMPRMDGFELATHMQNDEAFFSIPIIMITSRTGEKHRDRAIEIGVTNYMGKPYQEDELIENIQGALGSR